MRFVKFRVSFFFPRRPRDDTARPYSDVMEVTVPQNVTTDTGELGRYIRDRFYPTDAFVKVIDARAVPVEVADVEVVGVDEVREQALHRPRRSLPALPEYIVRALRGGDFAARKTINRILNTVKRKLDPVTPRYYGRLTLDLDDIPPNARAVRGALKRRGYSGSFEWRPSAGGKGAHVRLVGGHHGRQASEVFKVRYALGDDARRVMLDVLRFRHRHDREALRGVTFDYKGGKQAGEWRRVSGRRKRRSKEAK